MAVHGHLAQRAELIIQATNLHVNQLAADKPTPRMGHTAVGVEGFLDTVSGKDIAAIPGISRSAVYGLRSGVMYKIGTENMTELTEFAIRNQQDAWI